LVFFFSKNQWGFKHSSITNRIGRNTAVGEGNKISVDTTKKMPISLNDEDLKAILTGIVYFK